ncbi:hypothetical protein [Acinetobacter sp. ANC 4640]
MSNILKRIQDLFPRAAEYVGTIQSENHPYYKVLLVDGTGLVMCTSAATWRVGQRVYFSNQIIQREAPSGTVIDIEL